MAVYYYPPPFVHYYLLLGLMWSLASLYYYYYVVLPCGRNIDTFGHVIVIIILHASCFIYFFIEHMLGAYMWAGVGTLV